MYVVNGWRDICSALRVEALISKRNTGHELNKTLINCDVNMTFQSAPCACTTLILSAYYEVNKKSIFIILHQIAGRVFIFLHI